MDNNSREALAFPEDQEDELPVSFSPTLPVVDEDKELTLDEVSFERGRPSSKSFLGYVSALYACVVICIYFNVIYAFYLVS